MKWSPPTSPESDDLMPFFDPSIDQGFDAWVESGDVAPASQNSYSHDRPLSKIVVLNLPG
jgi:hypothetical protein